MGSTTCDNYGSVLNFRVMQLFPSQPITSPVSCNSRDGGRVGKNVWKEKLNFIVTVCIDGFSKWLSLRKDKCCCDTVDGGDGP